MGPFGGLLLFFMYMIPMWAKTKRILFMAGSAAAVTAILSSLSCVGLPEPAGEEDSLVIGSLNLEFPEGLYEDTPQKIDMNVQLTFRNVTRNQRFHVYTKRGYFYFLTNGSDEYVLEGFRILKTETDDTVHTFSGQTIGMRIRNSPNRVIYLGHVTVAYSAPRLVRRIGPGGAIRYYRYESRAAVRWDQDRLRRYLAERRSDGPWLELEIEERGSRGRAGWQPDGFMERRARRNFLFPM